VVGLEATKEALTEAPSQDPLRRPHAPPVPCSAVSSAPGGEATALTSLEVLRPRQTTNETYSKRQ